MQKKIPWDKIGKYISGEASPEERKEVEAWVKADPDHEVLFEELQDIWETKKNETWDADAAWKNISRKLTDDKETSLRLVNLSGEGRVKNTDFSSKTNRNKILRYRVAASLILIVGVLFALILSLEHPAHQEPSAMQELIVERGQRSQFKLSDGTQVWLNSESRLEVPARFSGDFREVHLKGEAFFDVAENSDKPFLVHARESVTKVLGTQFDLQAYPGEQVQIVVKEGRVFFGSPRADEESSELVKNQRAVLSDSNHLTINEVTDLERYIGWTEGRLVFEDTPLKEIAKKLERRYDIDCTIEEPALEERTVTARFKEESITEVLDIIALSVGISYEKNKQSVKFLNGNSKQILNKRDNYRD